MTIASLSINDWRYPVVNGSSVLLTPPVAPDEELASIRTIHSEWMSPENSAGVSNSAGFIQTMIGRATRELWNWLEVPLPESFEVEREIIVLMPPKGQRTITLQVRQAGKATPLTNLQDLYIDSLR